MSTIIEEQPKAVCNRVENNTNIASRPVVSVVIPTFNEENNISVMAEALIGVLHGMSCSFELIFVDDGSSDNSLCNIKQMAETMPDRVFFVSFSRNFGHQSAVKAGYEYARGECIITIDCDMQHPPRMIPEMIDLWREGYEVI